jgi:hypothetical protein
MTADAMMAVFNMAVSPLASGVNVRRMALRHDNQNVGFEALVSLMSEHLKVLNFTDRGSRD